MIGTYKSDIVTVPNMIETFSALKRRGVAVDKHSTYFINESNATMLPVKRILENVCLKHTHPNIKMLRYNIPSNQSKAAASSKFDNELEGQI